MTIYIGDIKIENPVILAPMAGVTDLPFRMAVKKYGAGLICSEMMASRVTVGQSRKVMKEDEDFASQYPMAVQIAGCEPDVIAEAARIIEGAGAAIIDLNFGCPVKKIVNKMGGSSLMRDEVLSAQIMEQAVKAVNIPVTMKMRLGWDDENLNSPNLAKIAENSGIKMITVHGRTRCQFFNGIADWTKVRPVKEATKLPLIVNGDITSQEKAKLALEASGADGVMIGRGAYGKPWLLKQTMDYLYEGKNTLQPSDKEIAELMLEHYEGILSLYGERVGVPIARKHLSWYLQNLPNSEETSTAIKIMDSSTDVKSTLHKYFLNTLGL